MTRIRITIDFTVADGATDGFLDEVTAAASVQVAEPEPDASGDSWAITDIVAGWERVGG